MRNPEFNSLLDKIGKMHDSKNADYANETDPFANFRMCENMGLPAWKGCMVRMGDKFQRLSEFARKGTVENEKIEDTFLDLAVYSLIGLLLYQEKHVELLDKAVADSSNKGKGELHGKISGRTHMRVEEDTGFIRQLTVTEPNVVETDAGTLNQTFGNITGETNEENKAEEEGVHQERPSYIYGSEDGGKDLGGC